MSLLKAFTRFRCVHRWSYPTISRSRFGSSGYSEWFCMDCGTRRGARYIG
jgi:hypothetical protein